METPNKNQVGLDFQDVFNQSKNKIAEIQSERDKKVTSLGRNLTFGGLGFLMVLFIGAIGLQLITGVIAIFVTVVFGLLSFFLLKHARKLDPLIAQKVKNYVLEQQLKEAQENNIIQLQNILLARKNKLDLGYKARTEMKGYLNKLKMKLDNSDSSDMYYNQKVELYKKVELACKNNGEVLKKAKASLEQFEKKVHHYKDMTEFTKIANKAMSALDNDHLEEMLSLEAFSTIETDFCNAMAELDTSIEMTDVD